MTSSLVHQGPRPPPISSTPSHCPRREVFSKHSLRLVWASFILQERERSRWPRAREWGRGPAQEGRAGGWWQGPQGPQGACSEAGSRLHHQTRCHGRSVFSATKSPSCSQAGAAWILTAALHLQGQGVKPSLHSPQCPFPPGLGSTNKWQGACLAPQLGQASLRPSLHPAPCPCPPLSLVSAVHVLPVGVIPGCRHQLSGRWTQKVACCVGRGTLTDSACPQCFPVAC